MRVAHIVCTYPPYHGGMGNVAHSMINELAQRGHDVRVITPQYGDTAEQEAYVTELNPRIAYGNAAWLPQILKELDDMDVIHLHYPFFGVANLVRKYKLRHPDVPVVMTYHMDNRATGVKGLFFQLYSKYWMPRILSSADAITVSSFDFAAASDAEEIFEKQKEKWFELAFGVDIERFHIREKPAALLSKHAIDPHVPTVLFVGGMDDAHSFKGITTLLQALRIIKSEKIDIQAILVGGGNRKDYYASVALGMGLRDRVTFTGRIEDEELPYYYNLADALVLPSDNTAESFGIVLIEAFASGIPVIASDLPGVRTVARKAGVTAEPQNPQQLAQAIVQTLSEPLTKETQNYIRNIALQDYSWSIIGDQLEDLYRRLVDKS